MTKDEIIRMAHEASPDMTWYAGLDDPTNVSIEELEFLERFAALVAAAEREACAKVCEHEAKELNLEAEYAEDGSYNWKADGALDCAAAIRARGEKQ